MPTNVGLEMALTRLKVQFGAPYLTADSYIDSLLNGPAVRPNDVEGLVAQTVPK